MFLIICYGISQFQRFGYAVWLCKINLEWVRFDYVVTKFNKPAYFHDVLNQTVNILFDLWLN